MSDIQSGIKKLSPDQHKRGSLSKDSKFVLAWDTAVPMLGDRFFMWDMAKLWGISCAFLGLIMLAIGFIAQSPHMLRFSWMIPLYAFAGFYILSMLIALVFYFNRYTVQYVITERGVQADLAKWSKKLSRAVAAGNIVVGLIKASPTVAGTGILAETQRSVFMTWADIRKVTCFEGPRVMTLSNSWRPVVRLHCPDRKLYQQVEELLQAHVPGGGGSFRRH